MGLPNQPEIMRIAKRGGYCLKATVFTGIVGGGGRGGVQLVNGFQAI